MLAGFRSRVPDALSVLMTTMLLVVPSLGAQQDATVTGRVLDVQSGQPISAAQVFISSLDLGGLTLQNGRYLLQNVPAGTHTLSVSRIGYGTQQVEIVVAGGQTVEQNFSVSEEALQLDAIVVTDEATGETVDIWVEVVAGAELRAAPPRLAIPLGSSFDLSVLGGSGYLDGITAGDAATFARLFVEVELG